MKINEDLGVEVLRILEKLKTPRGTGDSPKIEGLSDLEIDLGMFRPKVGFTVPNGHGSGWDESFTNPNEHDPSSFRYLLHAIQDPYARVLQHMSLITLPGEPDMSQNIDLSKTPGQIKEKKLISASVVDQDHLDTFGGAGLILSAPKENLIDISHQDFATNYANPDAVLERRPDSLPPLAQVLEMTGTGNTSWNEARLTGTTDAGEVAVVGYWIKVDERGKPASPEVAERMRYFAELQSLPLITFVIESEAFMDQEPEIHDTVLRGGELGPWAISMNQDGLRYFIDLDRGDAKITNRYRESRPMTSSEAQYFRDQIVQHFDPDLLEPISDRLNEIVSQTA